jgi:hypothetical protein
MYRLTGCFFYFSGVETITAGTVTITSQYQVDFGAMLVLNGTTLSGGAGSGNGAHSCVVA